MIYFNAYQFGFEHSLYYLNNKKIKKILIFDYKFTLKTRFWNEEVYYQS